MTPAQLVKALRTKLGMTQTALAEKLEVHPLTVHRWENKKMGMHSAVKEKLEAMLK